MTTERVTTADGRVLSDVEAAAHEGIVKRLSWASLHWGAEDLHPDALPHIAMAAVAAAAPLIEAQVRAQIATEIEVESERASNQGYLVAVTALAKAARIARGVS